MLIRPMLRALFALLLVCSLGLSAVTAGRLGHPSFAQDASKATPEITIEPSPVLAVATPVEVTPSETEPAPNPTAEPVVTPDVAPFAEATPSPTETPAATASPAATATPTATSVPVVAVAAVTPASITISKNAGRVGDLLGVSIRGFPPLKRVAIRFDGARKLTLTAGASGEATGSFRVPPGTAGLHIVSADGSRLFASKNFRVRPSLAFSITTVQAGQPVDVRLTGFAAGSRTKIRLYDVGGSSVVLSVWVATTDATGSATQPYVTKATLSAGKHLVIATDAAANTTSSYLTTTPYRPAPPEPDDPDVSQVYERGTSGRREVALTFDAGADRGYAEEILDTLAAYGIKATFGMTGTWAQENPDLVRRMVKEGHQIINHTWDHPSFTGASDSGGYIVTSRDARVLQLTRLADLVASITGGYQVAPYWRPPYGDINTSVLADAAYAGYSATIMWTCDSLGWDGAAVWDIVARCGTNADPGDIILMHVGAQSFDSAALPGLIEVLLERGFTMVTIERVLAT